MSITRKTLVDQILLLLGNQMVDVELDPEHISLAIDMAIERFRQRTDGSTIEGVEMITLEEGKSEYILPEHIQIVQKVHRRSVGSDMGGVSFDPTDSALSNMYLLQRGRTGGLATWHLFSEYQETLGRLFASEVDFHWNPTEHKLTLFKKIYHEELAMLTVHSIKTEEELLADVYAMPWIRDYSLAKSKQMLGEARSKFSQGLPGPTGPVLLNGAELKADAAAEMERLENELLHFYASDRGMPFIIG